MPDSDPVFPSTRYQGSKAKSAKWVIDLLVGLGCKTALDGFGGTGTIAWHLKKAGMSVIYNDALEWNHQVGLAIIENDNIFPDPDVYSRIGETRSGRSYNDFISRTFSGVYYIDEENEWLDIAVQNIDA